MIVSVFNCSLRSLRIALGIRLLRRHSQTKSVSARSSLARRRAIRCSIARSVLDCSLRSLRIALGIRRQLLSRRMRSLAAPATAAAASELVNINEVDAYVLRPREGADHGA
jgi:hypothetical protein